MKYSFAVAAVLAVATAQSISDLPSCSLSCILSGVSGVGCSATDFECSCGKADQLTASVTPCVQTACSSTDDQAKVITVLEGICASAGVPINIPTPGASSSSSPSSTAAASSSAAASESDVASATASASATAATSAAASAYPTEMSTAEESCVVSTVTVTQTLSKSSQPPYPTGPANPSVPAPSGTGVYTPSSVSPPQYTGAAVAMKVPAGLAGALGLAAYFL